MAKQKLPPGHRQCPRCGAVWCSADQGAVWVCECGGAIPPEGVGEE
ncbi:MAG: hypothetical protein WC749_02545 [Dehalococcoidia bacterium]